MKYTNTLIVAAIAVSSFSLVSVPTIAVAKVYRTSCKVCWNADGICHRGTCATKWKKMRLSKAKCRTIKTKTHLRFWGGRSKVCLDGR